MSYVLLTCANKSRYALFMSFLSLVTHLDVIKSFNYGQKVP